MPGLIAIVGRPNVGKSALFNRIAGKRIAIVHDEPGVTRDRISAEAEWQGKPFTLVDTGGIGLLKGEKTQDVVVQETIEQVELAIGAADLIFLVTSAPEGIVPLDREIADRLHQSGKTIFVVANKVDRSEAEAASLEFAELGFENLFGVSAIHNRGISALMNAALQQLPSALPEPAGPGQTPVALKLAIIGRPNVGKSSIINSLTRSERVIVSPFPGTTRDAVDVPFEVETEGTRQRYVLIDTAGMRPDRYPDSSIEFFSVKRAENSIARCDLAVLVLDAEGGITAQDKKIGGKILDERKACILVVNKWDLVQDRILEARKAEIEARRRKERLGEKRPTTLAEFGAWVQEQLFFLDYAPVIFTSAKSGFHLDRLLEAVRFVAAELQKKIPTALLNRTLRDAIERRQPISAAGHRLKFFYATQIGQAPPTFLMFVNRDELFSPAYNKYIAGELRRAFGYEGCPIVLAPKPRPKTIEPVRKRQPARKGARKG